MYVRIIKMKKYQVFLVIFAIEKIIIIIKNIIIKIIIYVSLI